MLLHCLGTTGYHPSPTRHTACYYLPELALVIDAGTGLFRLAQLLVDDARDSLDILISHAHLDHVVGLTFLLDIMAVTPLKQIRVFGEQGKLEAVQLHLYNELLFPVQPTFEFVAIDATSTFELQQPNCEKYTVSWFPLEHPGGAIGFLIETSSHRLAYVSDTVARPNAEYLTQIRNVDLLMHECYFTDAEQELACRTGHSWISAVVDVVRSCRPKKTLLIHTNPLAEMLGNEIELNSTHRELGICCVNDNDRVSF